MAEQKHKLVMDIVAPAPPSTQPEPKDSWRQKIARVAMNERKRSFYLLATLAIMVVTAVGVSRHFATPKHHIADKSAFPAAIVRQIHGFTFYYLKPSFQTDFTLQHNTISFQSGVLVFQMKNPAGKTLAFTEESVPAAYDMSRLSGDEQINTEYGKGYIIDTSEQTTGALFTQDNTWILINAQQPIGSSLMEQLLSALGPINKS